jgi:hypothetical protein
MDGIEGLLARDFGVRPQGKAAPMAGAASRPAAGSAAGAAAWSNPGRSASVASAAPSYDDLFGAPAPASASSFDSLFDSFKGPTTATSSSAARAKPAPSSAPVFDDDIFDAVPGLRPSNSSARYDDGVFGAAAPAYDDVFAAGTRSAPPPAYEDDDLLGGFGSAPRAEEKRRLAAVDDEGDDLLGGFGRKPAPVEEEGTTGGAGFDDLIPGFAGSSPPRSR